MVTIKFAVTTCVTRQITTSSVYTAQTNITRIQPGLKLTWVSFYRVNNANPGSIRIKSNPPPDLEVDRTRVEPSLILKEKCRVNTNLSQTRICFDFAPACALVRSPIKLCGVRESS